MGVALVTPFDATGMVDHAALARLVDYQIESRTDFLCVLGTTAETPTLSEEEQLAVRKTVVERNAGRLPILLGCGGNCTHNIVNKLSKDKMDDVDALLSVVPYYNKPTQAGMYAHFKAIADSTTLPIYLYNVPGRCGVNMQPETTIRLANECSNIIGFKAASGNIEQIKKLIAMKPDTLDVLSGDDGLTYEIMKAGGVGVISVFGNVYPKECVELVRLLEQKRYDEAKELSDSYSEMFRLLFADGNPGGAKAQLSNMGYVKNILRLPLVPVREDVCEALRIEGERLKK